MNPMDGCDQVNFLPDWYVESGRRRAHMQRMTAAVAMLAVVLGTFIVLTRSEKHELEEYHRALLQQTAAAEGQLTEVTKLQNARAELVRQVKTYRQLARPLNVSDVNAALAALTPEAICLTELTIEAQTRERRRAVPGQVDAAGKPLYQRESYQIFRIDVQGVAPTDVQIANYVGQLAACPLFRDVQMAQSRQGKIGEALTREFRIHLSVPLDREFRFVEPVEEVAHAQ